jgi:hypothetical protein
MAEHVRDVMAQLELSLVDTVARLEQAEMELLYVGVLELEQRIESLHEALAYVADSLADEASASVNHTDPLHPRHAPPGGGAGDQHHTATE